MEPPRGYLEESQLELGAASSPAPPRPSLLTAPPSPLAWSGPADLLVTDDDDDMNGNGDADIDNKHVTALIYGSWNQIYRWPPAPAPLPRSPPRVTFTAPSKLESVLFSCKCARENWDTLRPVKVYGEQAAVMACQLVNSEAAVGGALDSSSCSCRPTPLVDKFVVLPLNEHYLLHYTREKHVKYSQACPNTAHLLYRNVPSLLEISHHIAGLDVTRRAGAATFQVKYQE